MFNFMDFGIIMPYPNIPKAIVINHEDGMDLVEDSLVVLGLESIIVDEEISAVIYTTRKYVFRSTTKQRFIENAAIILIGHLKKNKKHS